MPADRKFEAYDPHTGPLKEMPLLIGITGPSGSGKSYSAEELARGIQRVYGGQIYHIDTENDRALELHKRYGGPFEFKHVPFNQPKSPLEYDAVLSYCLSQLDCGVIIFDNMTHEHVAVLDMMEEYFVRKKLGDDWEARDRAIFASQVIPKAQRKRFEEHAVYGGVRVDGAKVPMIFLYRGKDQTKPGKSKRDGGDGKPLHKGLQAETTSGLPYMMTARFLLPPGSDGHPALTPDTEFEKLAIKNPQQFRGWFQPGFQLTAEIGERLARWAKGEPANGRGAARPGAQPTNATEPVPPQPENGDRPVNGQPGVIFRIGSRDSMLAEVLALLQEKTPPPNQGPQRGDALELAFGTRSWSAIRAIEEGTLAAGLAALRKNLDPLGAMSADEQPAREPGED